MTLKLWRSRIPQPHPGSRSRRDSRGSADVAKSDVPKVSVFQDLSRRVQRRGRARALAHRATRTVDVFKGLDDR